MKFSSLIRRERNGQGKIKKAVLKGAKLEGVYGLTIKQLSKVKSLYEAKLDSELMKQVKEKYPYLLEEPK